MRRKEGRKEAVPKARESRERERERERDEICISFGRSESGGGGGARFPVQDLSLGRYCERGTCAAGDGDGAGRRGEERRRYCAHAQD